MAANLAWILVAVAAFSQGIEAVTVVSAPDNTSALTGTSVTLNCNVETQLFGEDVVWSKTYPSTVDISTNNLVGNTSKYAITGTYNLTIKNIVQSDEGYYQCEIKTTTNKFSALLTVVVRPTTMSLYWPNNAVVVEQNKQVNLTCKTTYSRPPATFRWFLGTKEITSSAYNPATTMDNNGFGDAYSIQTLTPTSQDENSRYKCVANLDYFSEVEDKEITVRFSSGSVPDSTRIFAILCAFLAVYQPTVMLL